METTKTERILIVILIIIFICAPIFVDALLSQPPKPFEASIDGGLVFLLITSILYAAWKLYFENEVKNLKAWNKKK
jgi:hypothetical protein